MPSQRQHRSEHAAAFAEGRRLREAARARRRRPYPPPRHRLPQAARVVIWLLAGTLLLVLAAAAAVVVALVLAVARFAIMAAVPLLVGAVAFVAVHRVRRRLALRRGGAAGTTSIPARPAAPPRPDRVWAHARKRFHGLRAEYAAYECDPMEVLRLPALADVTVPSTGRFVDAFAEAQALETDTFPPGTHAASFVAAVDRAERSWRAARDAAERIRLSGLSATERSTVERVIKLLTTARGSDSDAERLAAYGRARSELAKLERAGVLHVPRPAQAALDAAAQPALPA